MENKEENEEETEEVKKLGTNPFTQGLEVRANVLIFNKQYKEESDGTMLNATATVDSAAFTKVYVSKENRLILNKVSPRGKEMILWIIQSLTAGEDSIRIGRKRYMEENEIKSINTYKEAINELVRYGFIVNTINKDTYWINPVFMFRGDRLKKYPDNKILNNGSKQRLREEQ